MPESLSEALAAQGSFPLVYVTAVTAGERSGNLTGVLDQYVAYLRVSTSFRTRLLSALIYPAVLMVAVVFILAFLVTYAMPRFASLYKELDVPLPAPTRILLALAIPLRTYFLIFVAVIVIGGIAIFLWRRSDRGALAIDRLKPHLPVFGDIWLKAQLAQFARTLATLLGGGSPLVPALQTAVAASSSALLSASIEQAAGRVKEGQSLHASLAETRLIPGLALEMIEVGEASGALSSMLTSVAEFYEEEVNTRLHRALTWIPIVILVVMAVVIGFILISWYLPMFSLQVGSGGG